MASIGDKLREAREKKKLLWQRVHKDTKIHPRILKALEEDKTDDSLSPVYMRGFLKKYCEYLGLDHRELLEEYESLHPQIPQSVLILEKDKKWKLKLQHLYSLGKILLVIIATILFISYLRFLTHSFSRDSSRLTSRDTKVVRKAPKATPSVSSMLVPKNKPLILTIRAKRDSWMQVKSDGKVIFENVLSRGKEEKWTAKEKIELWVGNAEGLELVLNGNIIGSPGEGVIKNILITRQGMKVGKR